MSPENYLENRENVYNIGEEQNKKNFKRNKKEENGKKDKGILN